MQLTLAEQKKRESLKKKKPYVYNKIINISERQMRGIPTPIIDIAYDFVCDFHCKHCLRTKITRKQNHVTPQILLNLTEQADALGLCQLVLSGGEPLLFKNLDKVFEALQPDKFHIKLSTNGYHLDRKKASQLRDWGVDKISISLDSFDRTLHNNNRGIDGYDKAIDALFFAKEFDLNPTIATVVTHQNCQDGNLELLAKFAMKNEFKVDVVLGKPLGEWAGRLDILVTQDDYAYLQKLHEQYQCIFVDTFPSYGIERGCGAVTSCLHITPYGDVFPCVYIQVSLGNIFDESLSTIIERGMNIKYFSQFTPVCLSGRNIKFIKKVQPRSDNTSFPPKWYEIFTEDDCINPIIYHRDLKLAKMQEKICLE